MLSAPRGTFIWRIRATTGVRCSLDRFFSDFPGWMAMLRHTFIHLAGIGPVTERRVWDSGVLDWEVAQGDLPSSLPIRCRDRLAVELDESRTAMSQLDSRYFARRLAAKHQWRLYPDFRESVAFFDIETTGLDFHGDEITTIAIYDGQRVHTYVRGHNLDDFATDIARYQLLVTYNGRCFDAPFVEAQFPGLKLDQAHIDLRYLLAALGYRGGLKGCEEKMGLARPAELREVDGFLAVKLWYAHTRGDPRALPALLRYNVEDAINLRWLMESAYNMMIKAMPIPVRPVPVAVHPSVGIPFDRSIVDELVGDVVRAAS